MEFPPTAPEFAGNSQEPDVPKQEGKRDSMASERAPKGVDPYGRVTIQVGQARFLTLLETLTDESIYFRSTFSRWEENVIQEDGSYFYDGDPVIFTYILQYLRRSVLPVFYDSIRGHDHTLYGRLLVEAKCLQIDRLVKWIEKEKYLEAVRVTYEVVRLYDHDATSDLLINRLTTDGDMILSPPIFTTRKSYVCPRRITVHMGNQHRCGRQCNNEQPAEGPEYEDEAVSTVILRKIKVDNWLCCTWDPET